MSYYDVSYAIVYDMIIVILLYNYFRRVAESVTDFNVPNSVSMIHKIQNRATCTTSATAAVQSNTIPHSTGGLLSPRQHRKLNKKSSSRKIAYQAYIKDGKC